MSFIIQAHICKTQLTRLYKIFVIRGQVQPNRWRDTAVALAAI